MTIRSYKDQRGNEIKVIEDATFAFINLRRPVKKFESEVLEYNVMCIISEDDFDFVEDSKYKISTGSAKSDAFEQRFKVAPPFPEQRKQTFIRLGAKATFKDKSTGEEKLLEHGMSLRPKIFELVNGEEVDITEDMLSNGCVGEVHFQPYTNSFGTVCYLKKLVLTDVVRYTPPEQTEE